MLAVTKIDDERGESDAAELWSLGLGRAVPGQRTARAGQRRPARRRARRAARRPARRRRRGRPAAGRAGRAARTSASRACSTGSPASSARWSTRSPAPPSTRSTAWSSSDGEIWRFVDTAGLRRRVNQASGMEYYASLRTAGAIEAAEVAVVLLDASEPTHRAGPARHRRGRRGRPGTGARLQQVGPARRGPPRCSSSARSTATSPGSHGRRGSTSRPRPAARWRSSPPQLRTSLASWDRRIPTGRLNTWLTEVVAPTPPPPRGGKAPRVLFATQADTRPPRFVLFTTGFLEAGYRRFIERRLREDFDFTGTPIEISVRVREKRGGGSLTRRRDRGGAAIRWPRSFARRDVAQLGSAPDWGSGGRGFESRRPDQLHTVSAEARRPRLPASTRRRSRGTGAPKAGGAEDRIAHHPQRAERAAAGRRAGVPVAAARPARGRLGAARCSALSGFTDWADGVLARRLNQTSDSGRCSTRSPTGSTSWPPSSGWCCGTSSRCGWRS